MSEFNIEEYLNSLPDDIITINVSGKNLTYLPDLSRFKNLEKLYCGFNKLTSLPKLNKNLRELYCGFNKLTSLSELNENLKILDCTINKLMSLPKLNKNLEELYCDSNDLTILPELNEDLKILYCGGNILRLLPKLNENLRELCCFNNYLISLPELNEKLIILNCKENLLPDFIMNFNPTNLYYIDTITSQEKNTINTFYKCKYRIICLKYKQHFIRWYLRSQEKYIMQKYHPNKLLEILNGIKNEDDEEEFMEAIETW